MSWVCDTCSCNNDDDALECTICGDSRSAASIREGKRRAREEKLEEISSFIYDKLFFGIKIATMVLGAAILLALIIKIAGGDLFLDLKVNFSVLFALITERFSLFVDKIRTAHLFDIIFGRFATAVGFLRCASIPTFFRAFLGRMLSGVLAAGLLVVNNVIFSLPGVEKFAPFVFVYGQIKEGCGMLNANLRAYFNHSTAQVGNATVYVLGIIENIKTSCQELFVFTLTALERVKQSILGSVGYIRRVGAKFIK